MLVRTLWFICAPKAQKHSSGSALKSSNLDMDLLPGYMNDTNLKEELKNCHHFLFDSELEKRRLSVFNVAISSCNISFLNKKWIMRSVNSNAQPNSTLNSDLFWKTLEKDRVDKFMHTKALHFWRYQIFRVPKMIWQTWNKVLKIDVADHSKRERAKTKRNFYKVTKVTSFASLLRSIPLRCKDAVLLELLLKNYTTKWLPFEKKTRKAYKDNLCLFRAVAHALYGNDLLEDETAGICSFVPSRALKEVSQKSQVLKWTKFQKLKIICGSKLFCKSSKQLTDNSIVEVFANMTKMSSFYGTVITFATSATPTKSSKLSDAGVVTLVFAKIGNQGTHLVNCSDCEKNVYTKNV